MLRFDEYLQSVNLINLRGETVEHYKIKRNIYKISKKHGFWWSSALYPT